MEICRNPHWVGLTALAWVVVTTPITSGCESGCDLADDCLGPGVWILGQTTWSPGHYEFRIVADGVELPWDCTVKTVDDVFDCGGVGTMDGFELTVEPDADGFLAIVQQTSGPEAPAETHFAARKDGFLLVDETLSIDVDDLGKCDTACGRLDVVLSHPGTMWSLAPQ